MNAQPPVLLDATVFDVYGHIVKMFMVPEDEAQSVIVHLGTTYRFDPTHYFSSRHYVAYVPLDGFLVQVLPLTQLRKAA